MNRQSLESFQSENPKEIGTLNQNPDKKKRHSAFTPHFRVERAFKNDSENHHGKFPFQIFKKNFFAASFCLVEFIRVLPFIKNF